MRLLDVIVLALFVLAIALVVGAALVLIGLIQTIAVQLGSIR